MIVPVKTQIHSTTPSLPPSLRLDPQLAGLEALLEPGQCKASLAGPMAPFPLVTPTGDDPEAPTPSLLPEPAAQGGKATVPDDITDRGVCAWELNSSQLRMDMELTVPLVASWEVRAAALATRAGAG